MIIFHERVDEAVGPLRVPAGRRYRKCPWRSSTPGSGRTEREDALRTFGSGETPVLVSVKSLIEGIDVPAADTGISVASTSSVRQRVQALGRVLRRSVTEAGVAKVATMHLIYVRDTVDDLIYGKADWTDLTGDDANRYWEWPVGVTQPTEVPDPPRTPKPTEEQAWDILGQPSEGLSCRLAGHRHRTGVLGVDHRGRAQRVRPSDRQSAGCRRHGGRRARQARGAVHCDPGAAAGTRVGGRRRHVCEGRRSSRRAVPGSRGGPRLNVEVDLRELPSGDAYPGPSDKGGGTFKLSQRGGGNIERAVKGGREIAQASGILGAAPECRRGS